MELKQELKLKQTLSQKMIQSANILQMGQIELKEYIEEMRWKIRWWIWKSGSRRTDGWRKMES